MITTLTGSNALGIHNAFQQIRSAFVAAHGDLSLERYDAGDITLVRLNEATQAMPFLVDKRMVIIDSPSSNKELAENIKQLLKGIPETTDLVFIEPKFDKRSLLYKTLQKQTDFQEFNELNDAQLATWLVGYAKQQHGVLGASEARMLIARVGNSQLRLKNELDKLLAFSPTVTREVIEILTAASSQSTTFDLLDAALGGKTHLALELYQDQRRQRVEPQAILALIAWQLHVLATVKAAGSRALEQIARDTKINPYVLRKTSGLARGLTMTSIKELVSTAFLLDRRLKRETIDADEAMQNLLVSIALSK